MSSIGPETGRDGFYAAGFWGPRGENLDSAARRLKRFLDQLKTIHPLLAEWYFGVTHEGAPRIALPNSEAGLRELVATRAARTRGDASSEIAHELGVIVGAWAGDHSVSASLTARFGYTTERVGNAIVLNLPAALDPVFTDLVRSQALLDAIVSAWDPDRAVLRPQDVLREDAPAVRPGETVRAEALLKRFPDWIAFKRGEPLELGGPFQDKAT